MNKNKHSSKLENIKENIKETIEQAKKVRSDDLAKALLYKAFKLRKLVLACGLVALLSGCASETGWRFEIGVSPVKELNNQAGLKQVPAEKVRY